ncbi:MAG: MFS transporter, partial [Thermoproteus sp.]
FSLAAFLSSNSLLLMAELVAIGAAAAMIFGTNYAIITSVYPEGERGKAIGINTLAVYTGLTSGPVVGGLFASTNWHYIFLVNLALALASLALFRGVESGGPYAHKYDIVGAVLLTASLSLSVWGLTYSPYMAALGVVLLALFVVYELKSGEPLLDLSLFKRVRFSAAAFAAMLNYIATFAVTYVLSLYLQDVRGFSPLYAGFLLLSQPAVMAIFAPISGWLSDFVEPGLISSLGMWLAAAALASMALIGAGTPISALEAELVLLGFGFAFFISPNTNIIMSSVEPKHRGVASAVVAVMRLIGQSLSMAIAASILLPSRSLLPSIRESLAVLSAIAIAAAVLSLARIRRPFVVKRPRRVQ